METIWEDDPPESDFSEGDTATEVKQTSPTADFEIPHTDLLVLTEEKVKEIWNKNEFTEDMCQDFYEYG